MPGLFMVPLSEKTETLPSDVRYVKTIPWTTTDWVVCEADWLTPCPFDAAIPCRAFATIEQARAVEA